MTFEFKYNFLTTATIIKPYLVGNGCIYTFVVKDGAIEIN